MTDIAWHRERVRTRILYARFDTSSPVEVLSNRLTLRNTWEAYRLAVRSAHGNRKVI